MCACRDTAEQEDMVDSVTNMISPLLREQASKFLSEYESGQIANDFASIVFSRSVRGTEPGLYERCFDIYQRGGFPCGWQGTYPAGRLVVFVPPELAQK